MPKMQDVQERPGRSAAAARRVLEVLPLKNGVLMPTVVMPLFVGRTRSVAALKNALDRGRELFVIAQRDPELEEPGLADLHEIGTIARVLHTVAVNEGTMKVLVEGVRRARVVALAKDEPLTVELEELQDRSDSEIEALALRRAALDRLAVLAKGSGRVPAELVAAVGELAEPGRVADALAGYLEAAASERQELLATLPVERRLERVLALLEREIQISKVEKTIHGRVKKSVEKQSREHYLREQMKAIRKELGDDAEEEDEIQALRRKIDEAGLPKAARKAALKEVDRLSKMGPGSAETSVIRSYLNVVLEMPWSKTTEDSLDLARAKGVLEKDHAGLAEVKDRVLDFLAVGQLKGSIRGPILCFAGPPGVGKTSLGRSIARALGRKFARISVGGMRDEAEIRGHRRTYVGAMPGRIVQALRRLGTSNPVILLDEIDKTGSDWRGDTASALLEVLDPEQNGTFTDHYLELPFDLSKVLFITTANVIEMVPDALRDRMEVIRVAGYTEPEKVAIARRHLLPRQRRRHGIARGRLSVTRPALERVIRHHTREAGVRELDRKLAHICRKAARALVEQGAEAKLVVRGADVEKHLGQDRFRAQTREAHDEIGVAMGLAWTPVGGTTLPIEAVAVPGNGKLILTGQLGQVMQESAQAAITFARARATELGLTPGFHKDLDLHVHAPEGGVPKDGPSAGITIATAVVSALSGVPVSRDVAMTGEITLRGRVLPVGGIKEKVLAAWRAGIRRIVMSQENRRDLEELPADVRQDLDVRFVTQLAEVLDAALAPATPP
jgi:ATP-dependent Lon protease